jgi:nitroimidazol reductase NimA-like FMN-containing flavoprotein (pyridoxamine 5'-phosphate oxidase superfamily)
MIPWRRMRRSDREMSDEEIEAFIKENKVGRLGTINARGYPYVIPLNYVYDEGRFIFHCAPVGEKLDNILADPRVCFEIDSFTKIIPGEKPCNYTVQYRSVVAFGKAFVVEGLEKKMLLERFVESITGRKPQGFTEEELQRVAVIPMEVEWMTGKQNRV